MKKIVIICLCAFLCKVNILQAQSVGIGTTTPNPSAALDVSSSNKGFLPPRMSSTQRTAIPNPKKGLMVYDTTQSEHVYFDGGKWRPFYEKNYDSAVVDYSSAIISYTVNMGVAANGQSLYGNSSFIYDSGGPNGNYLPNTNSFINIPFDNSTLSIKINIEEMNLEVFYDSLFILQEESFNVFDTIAKLSGIQIGNFILNNSVRLVFKSNNVNNLSGFKIRWGRVKKGSIAPIEAPLFGWHIDNNKIAAMGGQQLNNYWHTDNVGKWSFSYGLGNSAKGDYSVAAGDGTLATGEGAVAMGIENRSSGDFSTSFGKGSKASGKFSIAMGQNTTAAGFASVALGNVTISASDYSTSVGAFNDTSGNSISPHLFTVGNGDGNFSRSNAMVVYKNGNMLLNGSMVLNGNLKINTGFAAEGKVLMATDTLGNSDWRNLPATTPTGFAANRTTTLSVPPSTFTDVLFTTQSADDGGDNYDPATGEFTAPTAGMYRFEASVYWNAGIAGFENIYFYVNGVTRRFHSITSTNTSSHTLPFTASFKLNAGDVVKVVAYHTNATAVGISANANGTYFTGVKVY